MPSHERPVEGAPALSPVLAGSTEASAPVCVAGRPAASRTPSGRAVRPLAGAHPADAPYGVLA
eukprot:11137482-Alexandrium_andersonii.AAC.1